MKKPNVMYVHVSESALVVAILLLQFMSVAVTTTLAESGAAWVPFIPAAQPGTRSQVLPKSSDTMGLCVDSSFFGMYRVTAGANETRYDQLRIPYAGQITVVGKPAVPMVTRFLEIPDNAQLSVEILYTDMQVLEGFNVIPAQKPPVDYPNATEPPFFINQTTYQTNAFYPPDIASLKGADSNHSIIIRGHRIAELSLFPVQFNPVTKQIRAYSKIEARLNYDKPAQTGVIDRRLQSPAFEKLFQQIILNYKERRYAQLTKAPSGAEYLIITHDDFWQQVQALAEWKEKKGLKTLVVNTSQINIAGPTAADIAAYIHNAYDTWQLAPSYVLLVGDSDFIPPHYLTPHPSPMHGGFDIPTDLYYATVDGTDYFPDIFVGRISVDAAAQANTIVNKILDYEQNPPANANFYNQVAACASFQDQAHWECNVFHNIDGYEDRRFVLTSEEIRDYLLTQGYAVDRVYWADAAVNPTNYSICEYDNGDPIPNALLRANGFAWAGNALQITNDITNGQFLIYHRDHGSSRNFWNHNTNNWGVNVDGWDRPDYDTGDITALGNGALLPVVFSIECQCGWFDGEVDQQNDPALTRNFESFCEEFLRQQNGGAIAAIGSTRNSASGYNDQLIRGCIDAIWPTFDPSFVSGGLFSLGQVLTYGKVYMASQYGYSDQLSNVTFNLFHVFGDPELAIWTQQPGEPDVSYPTYIGSKGMQKFVVNVTDHVTKAPIHDAKVCLQKKNDVYHVAYTDPAGGAYFEVYPNSGGDMNITVTMHNYRPHQGLITVTNDGATLTVVPVIGPSGINVNLQGSNFDNGESVDIYFGGTTIDTTATASAGSFTHTFALPTGKVAPLNVVAVGQTSGRRAVALFRRLPDQPLPDPYIYSQWDSTTWHVNPDGGDPDGTTRIFSSTTRTRGRR